MSSFKYKHVYSQILGQVHSLLTSISRYVESLLYGLLPSYFGVCMNGILILEGHCLMSYAKILAGITLVSDLFILCICNLPESEGC